MTFDGTLTIDGKPYWQETRDKHILNSVKNRELKRKAKETDKLKLNKNK